MEISKNLFCWISHIKLRRNALSSTHYFTTFSHLHPKSQTCYFNITVKHLVIKYLHATIIDTIKVDSLQFKYDELYQRPKQKVIIPKNIKQWADTKANFITWEIFSATFWRLGEHEKKDTMDNSLIMPYFGLCIYP